MNLLQKLAVIAGLSIPMSVWAHSNDHNAVHRYQSDVQGHTQYHHSQYHHRQHHNWHNRNLRQRFNRIQRFNFWDSVFQRHVTGSHAHKESSLQPDSFSYRNPIKSDSTAYRKDHHNWVRSGQFHTRHEHRSDPVVPVNARTREIQLEGLKRHAIIYEAYAELGNGRIVHLPELQGHLSSGSIVQTRFARERFVRNLLLKVGSTGHKRAYVKVSYKPSIRLIANSR